MITRRDGGCWRAGSACLGVDLIVDGWQRLPRLVLRSCDLGGLELDSCHLVGADLRGSRLHELKTSLDNLRGVTVGRGQLPDLTQLTIDVLDLAVRDE